jgi:hypothetical protein
MTKAKLTLFLILLLALTIPAYAITEYVIVSQTGEGSAIGMQAYIGQTFKVNATYKITKIKVNFYTVYSSTPPILRYGLGEFDTSAGTITKELANKTYSGTIPNATYAYIYLTFSNPPTAKTDKTYLFWLTIGSSDIYVKGEASDVYSDGTFCDSANGTIWNQISSEDMAFWVYGYPWTDPTDIVLPWVSVIVTIALFGMALGLLNKFTKSY